MSVTDDCLTAETGLNIKKKIYVEIGTSFHPEYPHDELPLHRRKKKLNFNFRSKLTLASGIKVQKKLNINIVKGFSVVYYKIIFNEMSYAIKTTIKKIYLSIILFYY